MSGHIYWRVAFRSNNGDSTYVSGVEIEMMSTIGGTSICTSGTAYGSAGYYPIANAFDVNTGTIFAQNLSTPPYVGYQFATPVNILQFTFTCEVTGYTNRAPKDFYLEWSDDNIHYTLQLDVTNQTSWTNLQKRTFTCLTLTGNLPTSAGITDWIVTALRVENGSYAGSSVESGTTYLVGCNTSEMCVLVCSPLIDGAWQASTSFIVGYYVCSPTPDTTPHYWKCTANAGESYSPLISLLLHGDGANNSTVVTDSSIRTKTITCVGGAKISTAHSVYGGSSIYYGGVIGDYINITQDSDFTFGTGDFFMRTKVYFNSIGWAAIFDFRPTSTNGFYPMVYINSGTFSYFVNSSTVITGTTSLTINTWYDVEICRVSGVTRLFVNGTQEGGNYTDANNYVTSANFAMGQYLNGYTDEIVVGKYGLHSSNFTSPSSPFVGSNSSGTTEPAWNLSGTTIDGQVTWTHISSLVNPPVLSPRRPS